MMPRTASRGLIAAALLSALTPESRPSVSQSSEPQRVSFATPDHAAIFADIYGEGTRGVVLAHGGRFTRASWQKQATVLASAGYCVLAIDFRGFGESTAPRSGSNDDRFQLDVLAAVRYLRARGAKTVSVVGGSFGGSAAAQASVEAQPGEIDRVVLLAHSPIETPEQIKGRKLFITGDDDLGPRDEPRLVTIRDQYERAPEPKELVILHSSAHAQFMFETDQGERLMSEILRFLSAP